MASQKRPEGSPACGNPIRKKEGGDLKGEDITVLGWERCRREVEKGISMIWFPPEGEERYDMDQLKIKWDNHTIGEGRLNGNVERATKIIFSNYAGNRRMKVSFRTKLCLQKSLTCIMIKSDVSGLTGLKRLKALTFDWFQTKSRESRVVKAGGLG